MARLVNNYTVPHLQISCDLFSMLRSVNKWYRLKKLIALNADFQQLIYIYSYIQRADMLAKK